MSCVCPQENSHWKLEPSLSWITQIFTLSGEKKLWRTREFKVLDRKSSEKMFNGILTGFTGLVLDKLSPRWSLKRFPLNTTDGTMETCVSIHYATRNRTAIKTTQEKRWKSPKLFAFSWSEQIPFVYQINGFWQWKQEETFSFRFFSDWMESQFPKLFFFFPWLSIKKIIFFNVNFALKSFVLWKLQRIRTTWNGNFIDSRSCQKSY